MKNSISRFSTSLVISVGSLTFLAAPAAAVPAAPPETVYGLHVGIGKCSFVADRGAEGDGRIFSAIATAAISKGVNLLASALVEAGKSKTWSISGSRNFEASSDKFPQCVQLARGRFYVNAASVGPWVDGWSGRKEALQSNGLFLAEAPDFFFEGQFVGSEDKSALTVQPVFSSYTAPIGTRTLRPGKDRSIAVFMAITAPGTKPSLDTAPAVTIVLGEYRHGTSKRYYVGAPASNFRSPLESPWFTLAKTDTRKPLTLHALVTETQSPNAFLQFVGSVLSDDKVKQQANTELTQLLIPSTAAAAESAATTQAVTAQNTADEKLATAIGKLDACRNASGDGLLAAASAAKIALRNYWIADQALDDTERTNLVTQDQINQIDLKAPATLKAVCGTVYNGITS